MNDSLKKFLIFASGIGLGSFVTWKLVKDKYKKIAQEEIDSVKEAFKIEKNKQTEDTVEEDEPLVFFEYGEDEEEDDRVATTYEDMIQDLGYSSEEQKIQRKPYHIYSDEYDTRGYELVSLTYYEGDGILTDESDEIIEDINGMIGEDTLGYIGEFEDDAVYARNDALQLDYEIIFDPRKFSEVFALPNFET